jgi:CMP-2-keto-3-deoxyoctulosonic acid synthetase
MKTPYYFRAYHLAEDGSVTATDLIEAEEETEALERLRAMRNGHAIELWDGPRLVGTALPHCEDIMLAAEAQGITPTA